MNYLIKIIIILFSITLFQFDSLANDETLSLEIGEKVSEVDEKYLSFAIDISQVIGGNWWSGELDVNQGIITKKPLVFDFKNSKLLNLTKHLSPAYLRVGGTDADKTFYNLNDSFNEPPKNYDFVMNRNHWDSINQFVEDLDLELMFTFNAGSGPRNSKNNWMSKNFRDLLKYTDQKNYPVRVWEFGNEVNAFPVLHDFGFRVDGKQYSKDLKVVRKIINEFQPNSLLAAPASAFWPVIGEPFSIIPEFLKNSRNITDIVSWHYYPQQSVRCPIRTRKAERDTLLKPKNLDEVLVWSNEVKSLVNENSANSDVWLGETGHAQCGGEPNLSDTFYSSFWWLDQLGLLAKSGNKVLIRQTLLGSDYGLLDKDNLDPKPDYWSSFLWKKIMGEVVLSTKVKLNKPELRTYAHCTNKKSKYYQKGSVSLLLINLSEKEKFNIDFKYQKGKVFEITTPDIYDNNFYLNNKRLEYIDKIPDIYSIELSDSGYYLKPHSFAFIIFPEAKHYSCN